MKNYIDVIDKTRIGIDDLSSAVDLFDKTELLNVFLKIRMKEKIALKN